MLRRKRQTTGSRNYPISVYFLFHARVTLFVEASADIGVEPMNEERPPSPRPRCRRLTGVRVLATGSYVPDAVITNDHLHQRLGFDSDWIMKRTGILERRHALPHQATSDLCCEAARRCIESARVKLSDIDLCLLATFTPDMSFPS